MADSQLIVEVVLPQAAQDAVKAGDLNAALRPQAFPQEQQTAMADAAGYAARLSASQRRTLLDALSHSLGESHGARVSFFKWAVGYELGGIQLSIADSSVAEERKIEPIAVTFAYKG